MVSAQQYLCSDYMQALSSTSTSNTVLDSSKSPLAMLARTCDSIGMPPADSATASRHHSIHRMPKNHGGPGSAYINGSSGAAKRPLSSQANVAGTADQKSEPGGHKRLKPSCTNAGSAAASKNTTTISKQDQKRAFPAATSSSGEKSVWDEVRRDSSPTSSKVGPNSVTSSSSSSSSSASTSASPAVPSVPSHSGFYTTSGMIPVTPSSSSILAAASMQSSFPYPMVGSTSSMPLACYPSTLAMPRLCIDPLCKSCPFGSTTSGVGAFQHIRGMCPTGCVQCNVDPWLASYYMMGLHQLALANSAASMVAPAPTFHGSSTPWNSLYTPSASGALSCNWLLNGDKMCGKVVANYDEFLQHLKSHTTPLSGHACHWNTGDKVCGKVFPSAEELAQHLRVHSQEVVGQHSSKVAPNAAEPQSPRSAYLNNLRYLQFRLPIADSSNLNVVPPLNVVPQPTYPLLNYGTQTLGYPAGLLGAPKFP